MLLVRLAFYNLPELNADICQIFYNDRLLCVELKAAIGQIVYNDRLLCVEQNKVLIPPSYNRFLTWGFSDMSLRIGSYESERVCYLNHNILLPLLLLLLLFLLLLLLLLLFLLVNNG